MECNKPVSTLPLRELPIDTLESMPDYILTERDVQDPETGNTLASITRTPSTKLFPNGNFEYLTTLTPNNSAITIPARQVRAGYVQNSGNTISVQYAGTGHRAQFLMVGKLVDDILIQSTGYVNIPEKHSYVIGTQYYLGANGEPTTNSATTGQKLFIPVNEYKLLVNISY